MNFNQSVKLFDIQQTFFNEQFKKQTTIIRFPNLIPLYKKQQFIVIDPLKQFYTNYNDVIKYYSP